MDTSLSTGTRIATSLSTGTRVTLCGLQARPEFNGKTGRVLLKRDAKTGRFGIRLDGEQAKPLAIKPANLEPLPFESASSDGVVRVLLALPAELLECVLGHLSARALLRTSAACALLSSVRASGGGSVWEGVLTHPLVAPYHHRPPPSAAAPQHDGEVAFLAASQRRKACMHMRMPCIHASPAYAHYAYAYHTAVLARIGTGPHVQRHGPKLAAAVLRALCALRRRRLRLTHHRGRPAWPTCPCSLQPMRPLSLQKPSRLLRLERNAAGPPPCCAYTRRYHRLWPSR